VEDQSDGEPDGRSGAGVEIVGRDDVRMRITLTLDDDVARLVQNAVYRERRSRKQVINDALRRALEPGGPRSEPYRLVPHESAVRPGFDLIRVNSVADRLEEE
jgi:hypothetical protein